MEWCAQVTEEIDLVESLPRPENVEVSLRYILKHANYDGSESQGRDDARQESGRNEWCDLGYQGARAKAPPCPNSTLQTPLPQQNSSSREEEDHWEVMEERRRRRIAFENQATGMLRYLDNCNDVKVGITELQERVAVPAQIGISIQQVAQQAMNENGQTNFEVFWQAEGELFVASWARWEAQRKGLVDLERRCQDISREVQMLIKRQENFQNAIDGRLRVQDRPSERLQDQIIKEIKELESTKTEEALQLAKKEHVMWIYQNEKEEATRLQGERKLRKDEEMSLAPPRKKSDWPGWEEATKMEESEWRLEPEGEAEVAEIIIVSDAVEGTLVDLDGESRHEQVEAKLLRRGREMLNEGEEIGSQINNSGGI